MQIFSVIFITIFLFWLALELITLQYQKLWNIIKGNGLIILEKELNNAELNSLDISIISLNGVSEIKGRYISTTGTSIIFPYYLLDRNDLSYGILLFSKAYFKVKKKHKELKGDYKKINKHLKFK